jgi:hypothetical protein
METVIPLVAKLPAHICQMQWLCKQKVVPPFKTEAVPFHRCSASRSERRGFPCQAKNLHNFCAVALALTWKSTSRDAALEAFAK